MSPSLSQKKQKESILYLFKYIINILPLLYIYIYILYVCTYTDIEDTMQQTDEQKNDYRRRIGPSSLTISK
jgi:hypothetical protein